MLTHVKDKPPAPALAPEKPDIPQEDVAALEALMTKPVTDQLICLYKTGNAAPEGSKPSTTATTDPIADKATRSQIHQEVRRVFNSALETTTDVAAGAIVATVSRSSTRSRGPKTPRAKGIEAPGTGAFLHFTLFKENRDTLEATNLLTRMLKLKARSVHFAGTKDRRAATVQRCSVRLRRPDDLAQLNPRLYGIKTGDYEFRHEAIRLGQLRGNEFTIVVRDCRLPGDEALPVEEKAQKLQESLAGTLEGIHAQGWLNYFGHQRFGSYSTGTNKIGMLIFSGRLEEAVDRLLEYDPAVLEAPPGDDLPRSSPRHDEYSRALACRLFREGDADKALGHLPRRFAAETTLITHLGRVGSGRDFPGALLRLPRGLRTLYLHAYQSFVWNHAASKRWELYRGKVVAGDLVADDKPVGKSEEGLGDGEEEEDTDEGTVCARPLSAEEASSGKFSINDVVLPSVGTDTILPDNDVGAFYRAFMRKPENGGLDPLELPKSHKEFTAPGRYRPLIARFLGKPGVEVRRYSADDEQMWPTDLDLLEKEARERARVGEKRGAEEGRAGPSKKAKVEDGDSGEKVAGAGEGEGAKVAAILHFQLGRSAYATVAIREMGLAPEGEGQGEKEEQADAR